MFLQPNRSTQQGQSRRDQVNMEVLDGYYRYQGVIAACLSRILALPINQALYVLDCLCENPDGNIARRLHVLDLEAAPVMQIPLILDDQSNPELIVGDLTALSRMVKKKDREKFWLALALAWIRAMPRLEHYLDDRVPEKERLLGDDHAFRNYLRSELSNRLVMLF